MNLFYVLEYKSYSIAYAFTYVEAMSYVDDIPLSMACRKSWAKTPEDLHLPHVHEVPAHVWKVLSEIDLYSFFGRGLITMLNQYEEMLQQLEQIVETLGRIIATQEEIDKELGKELDILSRIAGKELDKNPNP